MAGRYGSKWIGRLDRLQHKSLCTMVSVNIRTSKKAIQTLTGIVDMWRRHEELSARFAFANNSRGESHMSMLAKSLSARFLKRRSCFWSCKGHRIIEEHIILEELYGEYQETMKNTEGAIMVSKQQRKWTLHDTIILTRSQFF